MALYYLLLNPELPDENFVIKIHSKYGHFHFSKMFQKQVRFLYLFLQK